MKFSQAFPSKYLSAADLNGKSFTVTISGYREEQMKRQGGDTEIRPVLFFEGAKKGLVLNVTNGRVIAQRYGDDLDNWVGGVIELYSKEVEAFGEMKQAVRIRIPKEALGHATKKAVEKIAPAVLNEAPDDDEDPFGGPVDDSDVPF